MLRAANEDMTVQLSAYELQRLAHIQRNQEFMARLGIVDTAAKVAALGGAIPLQRCGACYRRRHATASPLAQA